MNSLLVVVEEHITVFCVPDRPEISLPGIPISIIPPSAPTQRYAKRFEMRQ